jgi:hypothetical protein
MGIAQKRQGFAEGHREANVSLHNSKIAGNGVAVAVIRWEQTNLQEHGGPGFLTVGAGFGQA